MFLKHFLGRRSVAAVIAAAEKVDVAWTAAMAVNTIVVWGANVLLRAEAAPAPANDTVIVAVAPEIALPKAPVLLPLGEPTQAVWGYLCNRDVLIREAAERPCPTVTFAEGDLLTLGPLKRDERDAVYGRQHANDNHDFDALPEGQDQ